MGKLKDYILDSVEVLIDGKLRAFRSTSSSMFKSYIHSVNTDGAYTIVKDKNTYNVKNGLGTTLSLGQNVWVMIPNGKIKDMFICGVR